MRHCFKILFLLSMLVFGHACTTTDSNEGGGFEAGADEALELDDSKGAKSSQAASKGTDEVSDEEVFNESQEAGEPAQNLAENEPAGPPLAEEMEQEDPGAAEALAAESSPAKEAVVEPAPVAEAQAEPTITQAPAESALAEVIALKYQANENGGTIVIDTSKPVTYQTRKNDQNNQFVVEMENVRLPDRLKRPLIMKEFSGPFAMANAYQDKGSNTARIVMQLRDQKDALVQQEGSSLLVVAGSATPAPVETEETVDTSVADQDEKALGAKSLDEFLTENNQFYGKRISIQVRESDIRDVIGFIAEESGANIVISGNVVGTISLKLREIPWDQALVIVMRSKNLGYVRQGSVLRIATLEDLQKESASAQAVLDAQKILAPVKMKMIPISYANVNELIKQLTPFLTKGRGQVAADTRTSSIIITDTEQILAQVSRIIKELDVPPTQVLIEGKIVEASEEFSRSISVNWGYAAATIDMGSNKQGGPIGLDHTLSVSPSSSAAGALNLGISVGTLDVLGDLNAALGLAESNSLAKVISAPRIVTMNNETAEITQEGEIASKVTTAVAGVGTSTTYKKEPVKLQLTVTPQVAADGGVILLVDVLREFAGPVFESNSLERPKNVRRAKTRVLVKNSQTAVIGGIYQNDVLNSESGIPWIKDIPILGRFFKSTNREMHKNELLLFLTPRVLNAQDQTGERVLEKSTTL